ncbi:MULTISPECIES: class I SAM-dependent methyltransferase [unclassified Geodermatophilus]|uniref:class I SAM-dependent methyltransferase n=1 Tax=unclassified Geodermatophilus TaxID=2637632 RepID=UPI003EF0579C
MAETTTLRIDPGNVEQARAWDGEEGARWAASADRYDDALGAHHPVFMAAAGITASDAVLDIGCGTGRTTLDAARLGGSALGVDLSARMLEVARARARAEGLTNVTFEQADAQIHPFPAGAHDVALGRTAAMFLADPVAGLRNVGRALRPHGRLVLLTWQPAVLNQWFTSLTTALAAGRTLPSPPPGRPGPFALSDPARIRAVLSAAGFADLRVEPLERPMRFGRDAADAEGFVLTQLGWLLADLDTARREQAMAALRASLAAHETPDGVTYGSAAWLVRARRPA